MDDTEFWTLERRAALKAENVARRAAERDARIQNVKDRMEFWTPAILPPIPFLQSLYDLVLARSEKRMPKWKFRLAADLVLEMQPKLTRAGRRFELKALQSEAADAASLVQRRAELEHNYITLSGDITDVDDGICQLKFTHVGWSRGDNDPMARRALRERVIAAFGEGRFNRFDPAMLLAAHCLICGKALTDPVSQARFIGPECAQTGSLRIPWLLNADAA